MASKVYGNIEKLFRDGTLKWPPAANSYKAILMLSTYTQNLDTHTALSDVSANAATGCTAQDLPATVVVALNTTDHKVYLDCGDSAIQFTGVNSGQTIETIIVYYASGTASTSWLVCNLTLGGSFLSNGQPINVTFNAKGVASATYN